MDSGIRAGAGDYFKAGYSDYNSPRGGGGGEIAIAPPLEITGDVNMYDIGILIKQKPCLFVICNAEQGR